MIIHKIEDSLGGHVTLRCSMSRVENDLIIKVFASYVKSSSIMYNVDTLNVKIKALPIQHATLFHTAPRESNRSNGYVAQWDLPAKKTPQGLVACFKNTQKIRFVDISCSVIYSQSWWQRLFDRRAQVVPDSHLSR